MKHKKPIYHKIGEGLSVWKITIDDGVKDSNPHIFEFHISDYYSIEDVRRLIEDVLIKDQRCMHLRDSDRE